MLINRLSVEILARIFLLATDDNKLHVGGSRKSCHRYIQDMTQNSSPFNLIHVCRYWRYIATSTSYLWTSLASGRSSFEALGYGMFLSFPEELDLAFVPHRSIDYVGRCWETRVSKSILQLICLYSHRWHSLYLNLGNLDLDDELVDMLYDCAGDSSVRRIEFYGEPDTPQYTASVLASAIGAFPLLQDFSWTFESQRSMSTNLYSIRWYCLTTVYVESAFSMTDALWCLAQCSSAKFVTLLGTDENKDYSALPQGLPLITISSLQSLTIRHDDEPGLLLQHFTLPSLSTLELQPLEGPATSIVDDFLERSRCPLVNFTVYDVYRSMTDEDLADILTIPHLQGVPNLKVTRALRPMEKFADLVWPACFNKIPDWRLHSWCECENENWGSGCTSQCTRYHVGWRRDRVETGYRD